MDRRRFLKYIGAAAVAGGAAATGYYLHGEQPRYTQTQTATIPEGWESATTYLQNNPPFIWAIEVKPNYLNPTTETTIDFRHSSSDLDNDPLTTTWFIGDKEVSHEREYYTKLPEGDHSIVLKVSDGRSEATKSTEVNVEPDQIYPTKPLKVRYKGVIYAAARFVPEFTATPSANPGTDEMEEQLATIRSELGCNALCLRAGEGYEDNLIEACKIALRLDFDRIYVEMKYMHSTAEETGEKLAEFAPRITELRETSDAIVFVIGSEFVYSIKGILPGEQWTDQLNYAVENYDDYVKRIRQQIPKSFQTILPSIKRSYDYPVAYSAEANEANFVPWQDPVFESVSIDLYFADPYGMNEQWMLNYLEKFRQFGKPINWSEFGCYTYKGGGDYGFITPAYATSPYDEDEQAKYIQRYCDTFSRANINGAYCYIYNEEWDKGVGLYNGKKRKKGFYMYKSYQRAS